MKSQAKKATYLYVVINGDGSGLTKLTNDKDLNASTPVLQPQ